MFFLHFLHLKASQHHEMKLSEARSKARDIVCQMVEELVVRSLHRLRRELLIKVKLWVNNLGHGSNIQTKSPSDEK